MPLLPLQSAGYCRACSHAWNWIPSAREIWAFGIGRVVRLVPRLAFDSAEV